MLNQSKLLNNQSSLPSSANSVISCELIHFVAPVVATDSLNNHPELDLFVLICSPKIHSITHGIIEQKNNKTVDLYLFFGVYICIVFALQIFYTPPPPPPPPPPPHTHVSTLKKHLSCVCTTYYFWGCCVCVCVRHVSRYCQTLSD